MSARLKSRNRIRTGAQRPRSGMTLIEVIVACSLLAITFTSLTALSVKLAARNRSNAYVEQRTATFFEQVNRAESMPYDSLAKYLTNDSVKVAFDHIVREFGGVDIVVSNAGAAWQGRIGEVDEATLRKSFELNFFAHQRVAQAAVKIMLKQGTGGCLLFNVSKQAVNPGANFGPYGLPKAATLFLVRQYAVDYGAEGIRSNAVNADRIRSGLLTDNFIKQRSQARGVSEQEYMSGNLLGREVTAEDVAQAFLHQALELKTTGDVTTVDGGNIAAALR